MTKNATHTVKFVQLPGGHFHRAGTGKNLRVTIEEVDEDADTDPLLRDVGRPHWPHRADS